jgi:hypothetical protein
MATNDTLCSHPITPFGVLVDDDTDERLRPATKQEHDLLARFSKRHPSALARIVVDDRYCYIDSST